VLQFEHRILPDALLLFGRHTQLGVVQLYMRHTLPDAVQLLEHHIQLGVVPELFNIVT
jgi:hypothetical protein